MIELLCPHCGWRFPVLQVESRGWCLCGMDYEILPGREVRWTPDERYGATSPVRVEAL